MNKNFTKSFGILILIVVTICGEVTYSIDTNVFRYLPLEIGNTWVYVERGGYPFNQCYTYQKFTITGTEQINGKIFYRVSFVSRYDPNLCSQWIPNYRGRVYNNLLIRIDSLTGNIYTNQNCGSMLNGLCDSLLSRKGDSATACYNTNIYRETCIDTLNLNIFGMSVKTKSFGIPHASGGESQTFAFDIGMYEYWSAESSFWWRETLKGCVINGVVKGDTGMILGINHLTPEVPKEFSLSQNYPNPFNPITSINFDVPYLVKRGAGVVVLKVYDVLGKEVAVLVSDKLSPGTYEVEFDGANYASGVYYYILSAGDPSAPLRMTKKMVLIK